MNVSDIKIELKVKVLIYIFLFFCFFPYFQFIDLQTDSQPYALLFSILLYPILFEKRMKIDFVLLLFCFILSVGVLFFRNVDLGAIKSLINYLSLFSISYISYRCLNKTDGLSFDFYRKVVFIWFAVGFIQLFIMPSFLSAFIPRGDNALLLKTGRGVVGLAPEPTFYGIVSVFLMYIGYLNFEKEKRLKPIILLLLVQLLVLSRSSMVIFILIISFSILGGYMLLKDRKHAVRNITLLISASVVIVGVIYVIINHMKGLRISTLLEIAVDNPALFVTADESVNERFIHFFFPLLGFIQNFGFPRGYNEFNNFMKEIYYSGSCDDLLIYYRDNYNKIMSGFGAVFFELGVIGFIPIYVFTKHIRTISRSNPKLLFFSIAYLLILFNAISFNNALIGFILGNIIYISEKLSSEQAEILTEQTKD